MTASRRPEDRRRAAVSRQKRFFVSFGTKARLMGMVRRASCCQEVRRKPGSESALKKPKIRRLRNGYDARVARLPVAGGRSAAGANGSRIGAIHDWCDVRVGVLRKSGQRAVQTGELRG